MKGINIMKELYTTPEIEIVNFECEDVITSSYIKEPELPQM